jgi:deazaflavin-dependent oxidoreductase (nitroreductase family)
MVPISWFYQGSRATAFGRAISRFWAAWASLGLPAWGQVGLEVAGRKSGRPHTTAVVVTRHEGQEYLVSMLGECAWVKNVRARGEAIAAPTQCAVQATPDHLARH